MTPPERYPCEINGIRIVSQWVISDSGHILMGEKMELFLFLDSDEDGLFLIPLGQGKDTLTAIMEGAKEMLKHIH